MVSIAECLFFVLDKSSPVGGSSSPPINDPRDPRTSTSTTFLAPILASMFLEVVLSLNANASDDFQNIQWTFWELAKVQYYTFSFLLSFASFCFLLLF